MAQSPVKYNYNRSMFFGGENWRGKTPNRYNNINQGDKAVRGHISINCTAQDSIQQ
jgi:hypothetical protein